MIAGGSVEHPLRRAARRSNRRTPLQLRAELPVGRLVGPDDIAALALHLMTNTAITGATYDIDGGQQLVPT